MITVAFLICALSAPAFGASRYTIPPWGKEEISVIKILGEMSDHIKKQGPILYFGPDPDRVAALRSGGLPAFGMINFKMNWSHFTVGLTHLLPFRDESVNIFMFMNHFPNFDEMDRVIKNNGFLIFDPIENPILVMACETLKWRLRFSIHDLAVYQKKESFAYRATESAMAKIGLAVERFNRLSPPYVVHRQFLIAA